ncbi:DUF1311 domain-containing protein [Pseudomonas cavernae]|uniref:DUF1311 domain-containing protein n=1 Tax=Pseudomonas cavernae TaxID=2320867 RepID=A0A385Z9H4_9PSED|nr:lysozyme inhibitor LprI family protein [Pseudomonas cavernae]AYC34877.1 DUF1311 domain-containing protein [Pseudomonas cavernae]
MKTAVLALALLSVAPLVQAADDCAKPADQQSLNRCAAKDYAARDKRLRALYNGYHKGLEKPHKQALADAQQAWLRFRDLACKFEASGVAGDPAYAMVLNGCLAQKTAQRTAELQALAQCEAGDLSCPAPRW